MKTFFYRHLHEIIIAVTVAISINLILSVLPRGSAFRIGDLILAGILITSSVTYGYYRERKLRQQIEPGGAVNAATRRD